MFVWYWIIHKQLCQTCLDSAISEHLQHIVRAKCILSSLQRLSLKTDDWSSRIFQIITDLLCGRFRKVREDSCRGSTESQCQIVLWNSRMRLGTEQSGDLYHAYICALPTNVLNLKPTVCSVFLLHQIFFYFLFCPHLLLSSWFILRVTREGKSMPGPELLAKSRGSVLHSDPNQHSFHHCRTVIIPSAMIFFFLRGYTVNSSSFYIWSHYTLI